MTIDKLPSGNYRIRMTQKGKQYSLTVPYKPKQDEAYRLITEKIANPQGRYDTLTFKQAANKYIESKTNTLSPSTIRLYKGMLKALPNEFTGYELREIDSVVIQNVINDIASDHSPKTTRNFHGFISAVLGTFTPDTVIRTTLPQKVVKEPYIPSEDDVKKLLEYSKDSEYYVALSLACLSLRRSEICALSVDDLDENNVLTINKGLVIDENNNFVIKPNPKTDASNRTIVLTKELADRIRQQGYIYKYTPNTLDKYLRKTLPKLGIEIFSIHKLRHFFASYTHDKGYSDAVIQEIGGWNTDHVMKTVYRHAMKQEEAKKNIATDIASLF